VRPARASQRGISSSPADAIQIEWPLTKAVGTAALVMTASLLTPIEPLDGGVVAKGTAGLAAGLTLF
jgi:hypothetical protein